MPEPQIRYVRTEDGVSIAYTTFGDGPPILYCSAQFLSIRHLMDDASPDNWHRRALAGHAAVTILDHAGIGASQRDVHDYSLDAQVRAIEAVAARIAESQFTVIGFGAGSGSAALYATRHGDRVRELVCPYPTPLAAVRFAATLRADGSLGRRLLASWAYPESVSSQRWFGNAIRESATAETVAAYLEEFARADLKEIFRQIPVRTLFFVAPTGKDRDDALALAAVVPDCVVAAVPYPGAGVAEAIFDFMGIETQEDGVSPGPSGDTRGTAVILFTDIVSSTELTERMGDVAFRDASRALDTELRAAIRDAGGAAIDGKLLGDGVLATFPSAAQAIDAALAFERAADGVRLQLHVGIHAGDVIREEGNVFGGAVNIAARISALSAPGEVLVSDIVRGLARTSAGVVFDDRGEHALKGVADAQRVYAVRREEA
jgi:class 3 adenylate cyclase